MQWYKLINQTFTGDFVIEYYNGKIIKRVIRSQVGKDLKFSLHGKKIVFKHLGDVVYVD